MKKICLTLLFLSVAFAMYTPEEHQQNRRELFAISQKKLPSCPDLEFIPPPLEPDYGIADKIIHVCNIIVDTLTEKYERHLYNISNSNFPWEKVSPIYVSYLIENKINEEVTDQLYTLSTQADLEEQETITNFLNNLNICKRKRYTLNINDIRHLTV